MDKPKKPRLAIFKVVALIVALTLIVVSVFRIISINQALPTPPRVDHAQGEIIAGGKLSVAVVGATLYDGSQIDQLAPGYLASIADLLGETNDPGNAKLAVVELEITNNSDEDTTFNFRPLILQSEAWNNGVEFGLYHAVNDSESGNPSTIKANSSKRLKLPYSLYALQFKSVKDWQNVDKRHYELVLSVYPAYHVVSLNDLSSQK